MPTSARRARRANARKPALSSMTTLLSRATKKPANASAARTLQDANATNVSKGFTSWTLLTTEVAVIVTVRWQASRTRPWQVCAIQKTAAIAKKVTPGNNAPIAPTGTIIRLHRRRLTAAATMTAATPMVRLRLDAACATSVIQNAMGALRTAQPLAVLAAAARITGLMLVAVTARNVCPNGIARSRHTGSEQRSEQTDAKMLPTALNATAAVVLQQWLDVEGALGLPRLIAYPARSCVQHQVRVSMIARSVNMRAAARRAVDATASAAADALVQATPIAIAA